MNCQALSAAFEPMQNWALLAVLRNMWTGWMRTYHVFFHSLLSIAVIALGSLSHSYASNKSVPFHFLFSTENASLSLLLFFFLNLTQLSVIHKSLGLGLLFTCYLFMPATCKLWRCSYKSVARHLDSCQEGNWLCLPTLALPAVLLNVHKTQPKPNKAHIPQASTFFFFWVFLYLEEEGVKSPV